MLSFVHSTPVLCGDLCCLCAGVDYYDYCFQAFKGYIGIGGSVENPMFPKVTLCDFQGNSRVE